ncbi:hypothetical protein [Arthrobacter bambusae]|uniref:hypothetical protein n=1 Tax=Arthrobacter bambusae TaxID=1338426 RepID=UPI002781265B|nr:hypothetical protein [Arthrobacter bambusae]MDQ0241157.1 hypothetical protein [Arthrobacter bambusae]
MTIAKNYDDGRQGAVLTKIAQGELIPVPFYNIQFANSAGATCGYASIATDNPLPGKPVSITIPTGANGYAYFRTQLWGRIIGLRMRRHFANALPNITAIVDGEPIALRNINTRVDTIPTVLSNFDGAASFLIAEDLLDDGPHTVTICVAGDAATAVSSLTFFGWLVERAKGAANYPAGIGQSLTTQTLTASAVTIASSGALGRQLDFYCSGATARTVTLFASDGVTALKTVTVPAGGTASMTWAAPFVLSSYKVKQDTGTDVTMTYIPEGFTQ